METQQNNSEVSIREMLDNMGDPEDEVECPIDGCDYGKFEAKASPFRAGMKPTNSIQPPTMA
jgi:hypothetical protein